MSYELPGYDNWKSRDRGAEAAEADHDAFISWCEAEGIDSDVEDLADARRNYDDHLEAMEDDIAERRAQDRADAQEDRWLDRHG